MHELHFIEKMAPGNRPKKGKSGGKAKAKGGPVTYTPEMLIEQGNIALANMQLELAEQFFSRALSMAPSNTNIMDALADVQIQLGESCKALELLVQSTSMAPKENPYKWFFLGQLQQEQDAVKSYQMGIQVLSEMLPTLPSEEERRATAKQIAKAHCSIAEIYLTDLCYEDDAEGTCEREVAAAMAAFPDSLDGLQTLASLRLSQNRKREAGDIMNTVYSRVMHIRQVVSARTVVEEMSGVAEPEEFQDIPEMDFCLAALKLLIECAGEHHPTLYAKALELGSGLMEEDDENIELWYLMGVASLGGVAAEGTSCTSAPALAAAESDDAPDYAGARFYLETAQQMIERLREEATAQDMEEREVLMAEGADLEPYCPQVLFEEQYQLVQDHLQIIAAATGTADTTSANSGAAGKSKATKKGPSVPAPVDEEWSSGEEEESSSMAVDK